VKRLHAMGNDLVPALIFVAVIRRLSGFWLAAGCSRLGNNLLGGSLLLQGSLLLGGGLLLQGGLLLGGGLVDGGSDGGFLGSRCEFLSDDCKRERRFVTMVVSSCGCVVLCCADDPDKFRASLVDDP